MLPVGLGSGGLAPGGVDAGLGQLLRGDGLDGVGVTGTGQLSGRLGRGLQNSAVLTGTAAGELVELRQGVEVLGAAGGGLGPDDVGQGATWTWTRPTSKVVAPV